MAEAVAEVKPAESGFKNAELVLALGVVIVLMLMVFPLPRLIIDLLITLNMGIGFVLLFMSMYVNRPVEFSAFPTVLLLVTLFRLSLNIAATRLILLHGNEGHDAAGQVIKSIGNLVIGGNYTVGIVVFIILVVINFVVITKGAGRIAEVAARFMLDAMPGKQMSIDADLNAGLIDDKEARRRRSVIAQEADFYGAMDGASKFVRGDAIAAILIILTNLLGGLVIGVLQQKMAIGEVAKNYTLLTVGEGLVAQIPALLVSTAAGIVVSRTATDSRLGSDVARQLFLHPQAILGAAGVLFLLALVPGFPHLAFMVLSGVIGMVGYTALQTKEQEAAKAVQATAAQPKAPPVEHLDAGTPIDLMEIHVGYGLIPMVDEAQGGELLKRITTIRRQIAQEMGIIVPPIHVRDDLQLKPHGYSILIKGSEVAQGELMLNHYLAMNPSGVDRGVPGVATKDPCFGLPALWVSDRHRESAQLAGYTVVDGPSVIATHLTEAIRAHAQELLGRQEMQQLLDQFAKQSPKVVEELIPNLLTLGVVVRVLRNLLRERVSIRDLRTILESLADNAPITKDPDALTEVVRQALARTITRQHQSEDRTLSVISIDPRLDQQMSEAIQQSPHGAYLALDPVVAQKVLVGVRLAAERVMAGGHSPVVLCSPMLRPHLRRLIERMSPHLIVLSSNEVAAEARLQAVETVRLSHADQDV